MQTAKLRNEEHARLGYSALKSGMQHTGIVLFWLLGADQSIAQAPASGAYSDDEPTVVLVARPELLDPIYRRTVLLVIPIGNERHAGFILNRPTRLPLSSFFPKHESAKKVIDPVYFGGPMADRTLFALVRTATDPGGGSMRLMSGLFVAARAEGERPWPAELYRSTDCTICWYGVTLVERITARTSLEANMTFKHILIPTDGSELSRRAIATAMSLAAEEHAKVTGLYVSETSSIATMEVNPRQFAREQEQIRTIARQHLQQIEQAARTAGVDCETHFEDGIASVPTAIAHVAQQKGCDLVVMGTHGRRGFAGVLQPSNAKAVAKEVEVPVLVVH